MDLLFVRIPFSAAQARTRSNSVRKRWRKEYYSGIGTISFTVSSLVWRKRVAQSGRSTRKHPGHSAILRCGMKGPKPERSGNAGIAMDLLFVRIPFSAAQARTRSNSVRKRWRKEYYSGMGTISFTVSSLVWRKRVVQSGRSTPGIPDTCKQVVLF
ncbi:hypothetical protein MRX96_036138 [Rhipicephalus microplus]